MKRHARSVEKSKETEDDRLAIEEALNCLDENSASKSEALRGPLETVEKIAQDRGLAPEEIHNLMKIVLKGKLGTVISTRLLKNLIPISVIKADSVISAVSWLCTRKGSFSFKVLILKWIIVMFDFIDQKENINALYGFIFRFLECDKLLSFASRVLCLLTTEENVQPFRVRKLLDLQARKKSNYALGILLWKYHTFAPEMVTLPTKTQRSFKTFTHPWKTAIDNINLRIQGRPSTFQLTLKDTKRCTSLIPPVCSSYTRSSPESQNRTFFPLELLQTFPQLLQNIQSLEPPAQIGSLIDNPLLLQYFSLKDDSVLIRLHHWMSFTLKEDRLWYKIMNEEDEFKIFIEEVFKAECFLQGGFLACEEFLWKRLPFWDGSCNQSHILQLVKWISFTSISEMRTHLYRPLFQLFCTSSLYFKCDVLESLRELLLNWLNCHTQEDMATELNADESTTQFDLISSLKELILFVNRLSTAALCLEKNSTLLMSVILDFYETVSDIYQKYNLFLIELFPLGIFYPALLSMDSATLDQLCYIMYRYQINLMAAKQNPKIKEHLDYCNQVCQQYNLYLTNLAAYLWTAQAFQESTCPQLIQLDPEVLEMTKVEDHAMGFSIMYHPALIGYTTLFLKMLKPEDTTLNFKLIGRKRWRWFRDFLFSQDLQGLKLLFQSSVRFLSSSGESTLDSTS